MLMIACRARDRLRTRTHGEIAQAGDVLASRLGRFFSQMPSVRRRPIFVLLAALVALAAASGSEAATRSLNVGASESASLIPDSVQAKARMDLAVLAGFNEIEVRASWTRGRTAATAAELAGLQASAAAAQLDAIKLVVAIDTGGSRQTPRTNADRAAFASYAASLARALPYVREFIVGNEPNLNRFWMPQFDRRGHDLAAPAYAALLARTYDALKAVSPQIRVIGGALAARGADRPGASRQTHSPTTFLRDLGAAYRKSHRRRPLMDVLAIHPYGESSQTPPTASHPRSTTIALADYSKLVKLVRSAFHGTAQRSASLPILYSEYGVQTKIPAAKRRAYTNLAVATAADAVSERRQADYYRQAIRLAYCQPTVAGLLFFHVSDESNLDRWQSGLFYADNTPKSGLALVRQAAQAARAGTLTCPRRAKK
jgi:hypothetical protein